jgi:serine/threonine-protein kinase
MGSLVAGRYEVDSLLAQGGYGRVFLAHHAQLRSKVALKLLRPVMAESPAVRRRFLREARVVAGMDHPNIVTIHDLGELPDGQLFLAMEYIEGAPLSELLAARALSAPRALDILRQCARGLDYAHRRGVVHRDFKPANAMVSSLDAEHDFVRLIDFGIVKRYQEADDDPSSEHSDPLTGSHAIVGTPAYMAPEQIRREHIGPPADQFALAVVAFEALTGRRPFVGRSPVEVLSSRLSGPPARLGALLSGGPASEALNAVFRRALAVDPAERFSSCGAFVEAAERALRATDAPLEVASEPADPTPPPAQPTLGLSDVLVPADAALHAPSTLEEIGTLSWTPERSRLRSVWAIGALAATAIAVWWAWPSGSPAPEEPAPIPPSSAPAPASIPALPEAPKTSLDASKTLADALAPARERALEPERVPPTAALPPPAPKSAPRPVMALDPAWASRRASETAIEVVEPAVANPDFATPAPTPSAARPMPVSAARPTAWLTLVPRPAAEVWINGRRFGDEGVRQQPFPAGVVRVEVRAAGGKVHRYKLRAEPSRHYSLGVNVASGTWKLDERRAP